MIGGAVHHWDENGLFANQTRSAKGELPPREVKRVQEEEVSFVLEWMREWEAERAEERVEL